MERKNINPWQWQNALGFSQAVEIVSPQRILQCAGQAAVSPEGASQHAGDMRAQIDLALDNIETVLARAGFALADVVRLNYYTTNMEKFFEAYDAVTDRLAKAKCQPASTLLGVACLARPELMVEIEATAAK